METLRHSTGRAKRLKTAASVRAQDLRRFLQLLEDERELATITSPVALNQEIGAVCLRNLRDSGPGLLFERPAGRNVPLAVDLLASRRRYALALGVEPAELAAEWNRRTKDLLPPVLVENGMCQQSVSVGDQVDLTELPVPIWNGLDGAEEKSCGQIIRMRKFSQTLSSKTDSPLS